MVVGEGHMIKVIPPLRCGQACLIAFVAILTLAPVHAKDRAKIEIVPLVGHSGWVDSVVFSPDGARVFSGSGDSIKLWDTARGTLIRTFAGHSGWSNSSVAFSPDGTRVLSGSQDKTLKLWDTATGALIRTFEGHSGWVFSVAFSPDGTRVLSGSQDK